MESYYVIPKDQFDNSILSIRAEIAALKADIQPRSESKYLTRKETANILGVSLVTLSEWTKNGKVKGYRLGTIVRYKSLEIEKSLKAIQIEKAS